MLAQGSHFIHTLTLYFADLPANQKPDSCANNFQGFLFFLIDSCHPNDGPVISGSPFGLICQT